MMVRTRSLSSSAPCPRAAAALRSHAMNWSTAIGAARLAWSSAYPFAQSSKISPKGTW